MPTVSQQLDIWEQILEYVRRKTTDVEYHTWFTRIRALGIENGIFIIGVPN